jgi:hypothetical protein
MQLEAPIPLFRIFDYTMAIAFYCDWLGFKIDWEHRFSPNAPRYLQISRDSAILHLTEHFGDGSPGAKALIHLDDIDALHAELMLRPNPNMNPSVVCAPWNAKILEVTDPFSNRICFNQTLPEA